MTVAENTPRARGTALELLLASYVALFQELTFIRWAPGQVRVLAYFPNLILISAFLGLGIGALLASRKSVLAAWPLGVLLFVVTMWRLSGVAFTDVTPTEHLWLLYGDLPQDAPVVRDVRPPIVLAFVLSALSFVPLGQFVGSRLEVFRRRGAVLWGYCFDLVGSLLGVLLFMAAGFLGLFPEVWFGVLFVASLYLFRDQRRFAMALALLGVACVVVVQRAERAERYSPYYAIRETTDPGVPGSVRVLTNGSFHQQAVTLRRDATVDGDVGNRIRAGYHLPYERLKAPPRKVLILGAGLGNDVSVALDEGAEQVDAVEIDPVILERGLEVHPDRPYASPRVRRINTDARSYLNQTRESYDLIVFGTLDSMTRLSALSSVRLDNFVYTLDCLRMAKQRLTPDGGVALYFMVGHQFIADRLAAMLAAVFGERPLILERFSHLFNFAFLAGPAFTPVKANPVPLSAEQIAQIVSTLDLPSDDWPYLYLEQRGLSPFYLELIGILGLISVVSVLAASRSARTGVTRANRIDWEMMLFGMGFLLLETKSVTQLNLLWGATWISSAVVFMGILVMVLLSTVCMQLRPLSWRMGAFGLVASLAFSYVVPVARFVDAGLVERALWSTVFVGVPIFFAGVCFSWAFARKAHAETAFGWNLLGAVLGGLLEFTSMKFGFRAMTLLALAVYLAALGLARTTESSTEPAHG